MRCISAPSWGEKKPLLALEEQKAIRLTEDLLGETENVRSKCLARLKGIRVLDNAIARLKGIRLID